MARCPVPAQSSKGGGAPWRDDASVTCFPRPLPVRRRPSLSKPSTPPPSPRRTPSNAPQGSYTIPASTPSQCPGRENTCSIVFDPRIPTTTKTALSDALKGLAAADTPRPTASLCANPTKPCHVTTTVLLAPPLCHARHGSCTAPAAGSLRHQQNTTAAGPR